jgi:hypothetical protein
VPGPNDVTTRAGPIARGANLAWVAQALVERREEILGHWAEVTADQPFHLGRRARAVANHIPSLFDAIVDLTHRDSRSVGWSRIVLTRTWAQTRGPACLSGAHSYVSGTSRMGAGLAWQGVGNGTVCASASSHVAALLDPRRR